jgi:uncharacterized membrane protein YciS (DUF1049 family)
MIDAVGPVCYVRSVNTKIFQGGSMWVFRSVLILIVIAIIIGFALYNSGPDQTVKNLDLILAQRQNVPIVTVVFWSFILGALIAWLLFISIYLKQTNQLREANKSIKGLISEVTALRNRPIEESRDLLDRKGN